MPASGISERTEAFIRARLALEPLPVRPDISLHRPTPTSGLHRFLAELGRDAAPPYWAYSWAGGSVLALHLHHHPELISGRSVLDFGAGSGLVGIAAARAGAARVLAFEPDDLGQVACRLNAEANGITLETTLSPLAEAEIVLAGDVFYDADVAAITLPALEAHAARGAAVLVGDPFRRDLPLDRLDLVADYLVPDMGGGAPVRAGVFALHPRTI